MVIVLNYRFSILVIIGIEIAKGVRYKITDKNGTFAT